MKVGMTVQGGAELARALETRSTRVSKTIRTEALIYAAEPIRESAASYAPREPGAPDLAEHIVISPVRATMLERIGAAAAVAVGPSQAFFYGLFQELGTSRHGAQPFMRPAFDSRYAESLQRLTQELWRALASRGVSRTAPGPRMGGGFV